jgi:hypothetical protein
MSTVDNYRIILKRDADFWQDELALTADGVPVPLSDAELVIHPSDESADVVLNVDNGKLSMPSTGVIRFDLTLEEIAAYEWSDGTYCLAIVYSNGKRDRSFLTGPVEVRDAC